MYRLIFKLKQHTPLIHFQHDQDGATLRATEVKPKLDRFIMRQVLREQNINAEEWNVYELFNEFTDSNPSYKNWLIGKGKGKHVSFDYKLRITATKNKETGAITIIPPNIDYWLKHNEDLKLIITIAISDLRLKVEKYIKSFFLLNNFGKRSSKGFGCFYLEDTTEKDFQALSCPVYLLNESINNRGDYFYISITKKWRELKSGVQYPRYKKSQLFKYMFSLGMRWDKRWLKVNINDIVNGTNGFIADRRFPYQLLTTRNEPLDVSEIEEDLTIDNDGYFNYDDNVDFDNEYYYGRALLGLAEHYEFQTERRPFLYQVSVKSEDIKRFKSPVIFKVFNNNVFALLESIPPEMNGATFSFDLTLINGETRIIIAEKENFTILSTPSIFNLEEFLNSHFSIVGFKHIK